MKLYAIRRESNWKDAAELDAAAARSTKVANEQMPDEVRWIRSYVIREPDGRLGSICIYQAKDEDAIRDHARRADLRVDGILAIEKTVVVRPDPD